MKKILATVLLTATLSNLSAQTTILSQDFNNGFPTGWELIDNDGLAPNASPAVNFIDDAFVLTENPDSTNSSDSVLIATSWFAGNGTADDYLVLPNLTLGAYGNYISFDAKSLDHTHPDGLEVRISTGGINIWEFFIEETAYSNLIMQPYWTTYKISLDSVGVTGQDVRIAFRHHSTNQYIIALDNISVEINNPVGIKELNGSKSLNLYPNPVSNNTVNLSLEVTENFQILDNTGRIIKNGTTNGKVDVSNLENGIYLITIAGYETKTFIKQ